VDLEAVKDEKSIDLEKQKNLNSKIAVIVSSKDTIKNETAGLWSDYLNSILNNMKSQQDELNEVLKGIDLDTQRIKKAKEIEATMQGVIQLLIQLG
jgi:hypothetical protein